MATFNDLTGQRFGRLVVLKLSKQKKSGKRYRYYWFCQCDCGNTHEVRTDSLTSGNVQSCGCLHKEQAIKNVSLHHSHKMSNTRLYHIWQKMKARCSNERSSDYYKYGGRGITVCNEWMDFNLFCQWALSNGYSDDLTIDRIDNNRGYSPNNCRWVNAKMQARNRRSNIKVSFKGQEMTLLEASELSGIKYSALIARWNRGVRPPKLFNDVKSAGQKRSVYYNGKDVSLTELSKLTGINLNTLKSRYRAGKRGDDLIK
jgi:hypothetical protein